MERSAVQLFADALDLFGSDIVLHGAASGVEDERVIAHLRTRFADRHGFTLDDALGAVEIIVPNRFNWADPAMGYVMNAKVFHACSLVLTSLHDTHTWRFGFGSIVFEKRS